MLDFAAVPFFFFVDAYQWGVRWCVLGILILRDFFLLDFFLFSFFIHLLSLEKCRFFFFFLTLSDLFLYDLRMFIILSACKRGNEDSKCRSKMKRCILQGNKF